MSQAERRQTCRDHQSWPERTVVRTGVSPMNPKVKWAELSCGHEIFRARKPRIGAHIVCEKCAARVESPASEHP